MRTMLELMTAGRRSTRYHTEEMHDRQRIDAHSWGVGVITLYLLEKEDFSLAERLRIVQAALLHDVAEYHVGDIPAPAKRRMDIRALVGEHEDRHLAESGWAVPTLSRSGGRIVKIADNADGCLHCIAERRMGNVNVIPIYANFWDYLQGECNIGTAGREKILADYIDEEWRKADGC